MIRWFALLLLLAPPAAAQPVPQVTYLAPANPTTIATGGTSQTLFNAGELTTGAWVTNPKTATENLYVCPTGITCTTTEGTGVFALSAGQTFVFGASRNAVTVTAATTSHAFSAAKY